jgi:hypothetical protein
MNPRMDFRKRLEDDLAEIRRRLPDFHAEYRRLGHQLVWRDPLLGRIVAWEIIGMEQERFWAISADGGPIRIYPPLTGVNSLQAAITRYKNSVAPGSKR